MIAHKLTLDYTLQSGWMAPFIEGVHSGQAIARTCNACSRVSFPPLRVCACGGREGTWTQLPGTARIKFRTEGADGAFGLVQLDGAATSSVMRLKDLPAGATHGQIQAPDGPLPMLILGPMPDEATT